MGGRLEVYSAAWSGVFVLLFPSAEFPFHRVPSLVAESLHISSLTFMISCSFPFSWRCKIVDSCLEVSSDPIVAGALVCVAFGETVAPNSSWISPLLPEPPFPSMKDRIKVHLFY